MKKNKILQIFKIKMHAFLFFCFFVGIASAVGNDFISDYISPQNASDSGSNNSIISFTTSPATGPNAQYVNKGNNSTIIGNYFQGYYYDSVFGFFKLDWSDDQDENVSIISATSKCPDSYGYKLGGYAYSADFGFIDFDYNSNIFVYYCEGDEELHGYGYSKTLGFQNFEGIGFEITPSIGTIVQNTSTGVFVNDSTRIESIQTYTGSTSNFDYNSIGGDINEFDTTKESIFYIIK